MILDDHLYPKNTIEKDQFLYQFSEEEPTDVLKTLFQKEEVKKINESDAIVSWDVNLVVLKDQLFIKSFEIRANSADIDSIFTNCAYSHEMRTEQYSVRDDDEIHPIDEEIKRHIETEYVFTFECFGVPFSYTGGIVARQYYIDEAEFLGEMRDEISMFVFTDGNLDLDKSNISVIDEKYIDRFVWKEKEPHSQFYYIKDPKGGYTQNRFTTIVCGRYNHYNELPECYLKKILSAKQPVLRTKYKVLSKADSEDYCLRVSDIALVFFKKLELNYVLDSYSDIDFKGNPYYPVEIFDSIIKGIENIRTYREARNCVLILNFLRDKKIEVYFEDCMSEYFEKTISKLTDIQDEIISALKEAFLS